MRRALPVLRQLADDIWTRGRALTLRATVHLALGAVDRAVADFTAAERLWDTTGQEHDRPTRWRAGASPRSGRGTCRPRCGCWTRPRSATPSWGTPTYNLSIRRCEVLMAAGLAPEALAEADAAITLLDRIGGQSTRKAELLLAASWGRPLGGGRAHRHRPRRPRGTAVRGAAPDVVGDARPAGADRGADGGRTPVGADGGGRRGGGRAAGLLRLARRAGGLAARRPDRAGTGLDGGRGTALGGGRPQPALRARARPG
ncbi:hypothetical protein GCM10017687_77690 [Streptomyces echinatus]